MRNHYHLCGSIVSLTVFLAPARPLDRHKRKSAHVHRRCIESGEKKITVLEIVQAVTTGDISMARELMLEYAKWLDFDLCFQGFEEELRTLPGKYAPPQGRLLLASWDKQLAGIGSLRPTGQPGTCEMKRLYVRPEFRGHAIGRVLAERLIQDAREIGYTRMRLDTVPGRMDQAIALYRRLGFKEIDPYYDTPVQHTLFMELALSATSAAD